MKDLLDKHELSFVIDSRNISDACAELSLIHRQIVALNTGKNRNSLKKRQKLAFDVFDLNKTFEPVVQKLEKMYDEI